MKSTARALFSAGLFLLVAGCAAVTGSRPTELISGDVQSSCIESRAEYRGYVNDCNIRRDCPAGEQKQAKSVQSTAAAFCAKNLLNTPQNRATIQSLVDQQRKIGAR